MNLEEQMLDTGAVEDGVEFPFGDECYVTIARWHNKEHRKFLRKLSQKNQRRLEAKAIDDDEANRLILPQWNCIIKGWRGLYIGEEPIEHSPEAVLELASQPKYEPFFLRVQKLSQEESNYYVSTIKSMGED